MQYLNHRRASGMLAALALTFMTVACGQTGTGAPPSVTATPGASDTPTGDATATAIPGAATPAPSATTPPDGQVPEYQDDRSSPHALMQSLANAINSRQYLRAYSYWEESGTRPPYAEFESQMKNFAAVKLTLGAIGVGAAAGNRYYSVPAAFTATTATGAVQMTAGCYTLHLAQPQIQDAVPFHPLAVQSATMQPVADAADIPAALATACAEDGRPVEPPDPGADPADISVARYLDDRSDAVQVVRSLFNAINRKEYARAYSYWRPDAAATGLPSYEQFKEGYADTTAVGLSTGTVRQDAGAGQLYSLAPVLLTSMTTGGGMQTFVGCYQLHLSRPEIQGTPPFQPLAVTKATVAPLAAGANAAAALQAACLPR